MRGGEGCRGCCREEFQARSFLLDHERPVLFMRAQWNWPVWIYLIYRALFAIAFTVFIILSGVVPYGWYRTESDRVKWFIYLTNHQFLFLTICTIYRAGVAIYASVCWRKRLRDEEVLTQQPWWLKTEWVIYNVSQPIAVMTSILYWVLLFPSYTSAIHWIDGITHGFNTAYVILDIFITAMPMRILHVWHSMLYAILYLIFTVIYDVTGGTNALQRPYIYNVLDWTADPTWAVVYTVVVLLVGIPLIWLILYGLHALRVFISWKTSSVSQGKAHGNNTVGIESHENPAFEPEHRP